eukprot:m.478956 g.478956  ORF g.478956 m.478956 type:complete len:99 (-) comp48004_c0_seq1:423-719(-)
MKCAAPAGGKSGHVAHVYAKTIRLTLDDHKKHHLATVRDSEIMEAVAAVHIVFFNWGDDGSITPSLDDVLTELEKDNAPDYVLQFSEDLLPYRHTAND